MCVQILSLLKTKIDSGITCINRLSFLNSFLGKSWKLIEIVYFYEIETGIEIFSDKNCNVTFGFKYIYNRTVLENSGYMKYPLSVVIINLSNIINTYEFANK